jgi:general secretion pathway protein K
MEAMNFLNPTASPTGMRQNQRGAVLIVVLWVVLAVSLLALSFSASIRTEVDAARNVVEQKQAYYMARAGIEYAVYELMEAQSAFAQSQQQQLEGPGLEPIVPPVLRGGVTLDLGDGGAEVSVGDESGKINLNMAPESLIFNVLIMSGVPSHQADVITDSIGDWIDPDDLVRPFGAERDYYLSLESPYQAKNGLFDVPEELLLVQGVTPEIYYGRKTVSGSGEAVELYGLQNFFTTFTNANRIDVNAAPIVVLAAIPGLDFQAALAIDNLRRQQPFRDPVEVEQSLPGIGAEALEFLGVVRSGVYTIDSLGYVNDSQVVSRIRTVVRMGGGPKGYSVAYWNESNTEL